MNYTIKEFAKKFHTTEHTVRYYTDIELLPCQRDSQNRRIFDDTSANWMQTITCLKKCGTPLKEIKKYCHLCHLEESEENLKARQKAQEAQATAAYMDQKAKHYEDILNGQIPDDTNPRSWN